MIHAMMLKPDDALEFWPAIEPYIEQALRFDHYRSTNVEKLRVQVERGFAHVIICGRGKDIVSATTVQLYQNNQNERLMHVIATAGDEVDEWLDPLWAVIKDMAEAEDCVGVTISGRPGWTRKLHRIGFKTDSVHMRVNLNGSQ